jgi:hypothetical protein
VWASAASCEEEKETNRREKKRDQNIPAVVLRATMKRRLVGKYFVR